MERMGVAEEGVEVVVGHPEEERLRELQGEGLGALAHCLGVVPFVSEKRHESGDGDYAQGLALLHHSVDHLQSIGERKETHYEIDELEAGYHDEDVPVLQTHPEASVEAPQLAIQVKINADSDKSEGNCETEEE